MNATRKAAAAALCASAVTMSLINTSQAQPTGRVQPYATLGEWTVEFVAADRQRVLPAYCQATKIFGQENALRVVSGGRLYAIDFMGNGSAAQGKAKGFEVSYFFDQLSQNAPTRRAVANLIKDGEGLDWVRIEEPVDEPGSSDAMLNAQMLTIRSNSGRSQWQYPLAGINPTLNALFDCRDEKVLGQPRRRAPAPIAQMPAPVQQFVAPAPQFQSAPPPAQFQSGPPPAQFQSGPPPMAQFRAPPPSGQNVADFCNSYANFMVDSTVRALQLNCPGWPSGHANRDNHFRWCMGKPRGDVENARSTWGGRLQGCAASAGNQRPPAQGRDNSRHNVCSSFAKNAERWENAAARQGCRFPDAKNETAHYNWCLGTSDDEFRRRSPTASGVKANLEKSCSQQLRRPVRL